MLELAPGALINFLSRGGVGGGGAYFILEIDVVFISNEHKL